MNKTRERGQAIVILLFALVAVTAMAGLAIDGGRLYALRRQAQNAADAAALAGTRQLAEYITQCETGSNSDVSRAIIDAARFNGIDNASPDAQVEAWYVDRNENVLLAAMPSSPSGSAPRLANVINEPPDGATGVRVRATVTETTTLLRIIGQEHFAASAEATAMTGPVQITEFSGGGLLPIGLPAQRVDTIIGSGEREFTLYTAGGGICGRDDMDCPSDPPAESQRGWLNFGYIYHNTWFSSPQRRADGINANGSTASPLNRVVKTNFSTNDLEDWVRNGFDAPIYFGTRGDASRPDDLSDPLRYPRDGDFILGDGGVMDGVRRATCELYMDQTVYLPIFDYIIERAQMRSFFSGHEPSNPLQFQNAFHYHIIGVVAARIDGCAGSGANARINATIISALIGEGVIDPDMGYQSGVVRDGACPLEVYSVSLWR